MFRIKVCGITNVEDAVLAVEAGADALGLNFVEQSPRHVNLEQADHITEAVPEGVDVVGVFVNTSLDDVIAVADRLQLDYIQLHGDEPPDRLVELAGRKVIRAFRCQTGHFDPILDYLGTCQRLGFPPAAALVDAYDVDQYGGTGKTLEWSQIRQLGTLMGGVHLVLAGGLSPTNVRTAIEQARPGSVDVASGVETSPGRKDANLVRAFVREARQALDAVQSAH